MTIGLNIKGYTVIIDEEDLPLISGYSWRIEPKKKYVRTSIHRKRPLSGRNVYMHRLIMGLHNSPHPQVDHKNRNPLDNRKCNLRLANNAQNNANRALVKKTESGYKGVYYRIGGTKASPTKIIYASISYGIGSRFLGNFSSEIDAAKAYNDAAIKQYGEFATLNVIL